MFGVPFQLDAHKSDARNGNIDRRDASIYQQIKKESLFYGEFAPTSTHLLIFMYLPGDISNSHRGGICLSATKTNHPIDDGASFSTQWLAGHYSRNQAMDGLQGGTELRGGD